VLLGLRLPWNAGGKFVHLPELPQKLSCAGMPHRTMIRVQVAEARQALDRLQAIIDGPQAEFPTLVEGENAQVGSWGPETWGRAAAALGPLGCCSQMGWGRRAVIAWLLTTLLDKLSGSHHLTIHTCLLPALPPRRTCCCRA